MAGGLRQARKPSLLPLCLLPMTTAPVLASANRGAGLPVNGAAFPNDIWDLQELRHTDEAVPSQRQRRMDADLRFNKGFSEALILLIYFSSTLPEHTLTRCNAPVSEVIIYKRIQSSTEIPIPERGLGCSVPAGLSGHGRIESQKRHLVSFQDHLAQLIMTDTVGRAESFTLFLRFLPKASFLFLPGSCESPVLIQKLNRFTCWLIRPRTFSEVSGNERIPIWGFRNLISSSESEMRMHEGLVGRWAEYMAVPHTLLQSSGSHSLVQARTHFQIRMGVEFLCSASAGD
ncbi:hypothetical protein BJX76DRAFT_61944 [Aspergillus varians]